MKPIVTPSEIDRINELARKQKRVGLTEEEKAEQHRLRRAYVDSVKDSLRSQLDRVRWVDPADGVGGDPEAGAGGSEDGRRPDKA